MEYSYYPGCTAHATSRQYEESVWAIAASLGLKLDVLEDWNCCGATAYMNVNEVLSFCLTGRNLALAEAVGKPVCTPCSACYLNLRKTRVYLDKFPEVKTKVNLALAEAGLKCEGTVSTKHLLEVVVQDIGLEQIKAQVKRPLTELKVAPYYGCQMLRPLSGEVDPENPQMMEQLIAALGATPTRFPLRTWCCGGSLMGTNEAVALRLCRNLLLCAKNDGADCIAVSCPLCQFNLEVYQKRINKLYHTDFRLPVVYFTQLVGIALGLPQKALGIRRAVVPLGQAFARYTEAGS